MDVFQWHLAFTLSVFPVLRLVVEDTQIEHRTQRQKSDTKEKRNAKWDKDLL